MFPMTLLPGPLGARSAICRRCTVKRGASLVGTSRFQQRRHLGLKVIAKREAAEEEFQNRSERIRKKEEPFLWDILKERGYVHQTAGSDEQISELMLTKRIGAYSGFDPTAASLHVGHLVPMMPLFWMYMHGYRAVTVIGGATVKIGDPTQRTSSREPVSKVDLTMNITKMHYQLKRIWINVEAQARRFGYQKEWIWNRELVNNSVWYNNTTFIEVVSRLFKGQRMGPLLSRDFVKKRLAPGGSGMALDEFIYPLVQAWDWWHMFSSPRPVQMQIGGSDQFGNIVSGIEAIKYLRDTEPQKIDQMPNDLEHTPVGFTVPLLQDSSGAKLGKSDGNAVWLDPFMTSSFDLYGYFMRRPDAEVERLLKVLTFLPMDRIREIMEEQNKDPPKRVAHHQLAYEVLSLVHSVDLAKEAQEQHRNLFRKGPVASDVSATDSSVDAAGVPQAERNFYPTSGQATSEKAASFKVDIELPESLILGKAIARILHAAGLASSITDAVRLTQQQGAYIGGAPGQSAATNTGITFGNLTFTPVKTWFPAETRNFLVDGKLLILRRGKHFIRIVKMVSDEEWKASGKRYPGEPYRGEVREMRRELFKLQHESKELGVRPEKLDDLRRQLREGNGDELGVKHEDIADLRRHLRERKEWNQGSTGETPRRLSFPVGPKPSSTARGRPAVAGRRPLGGPNKMPSWVGRGRVRTRSS